ALDTRFEQPGRVTAFRALAVALRNEGIQFAEEIARSGREATGATKMAGRANRIGENQQGVVVTIGTDVAELQEMPAAFALCPQLLPAAAEESDVAAGKGLLQRGAIHVAEHQHTQAG